MNTELGRLTELLRAERGQDGRWTGELSSSALSTAVAVVALWQIDRQAETARHPARIAEGLQWLAAHQNADGGWGDTIRSKSNISTTALCWAALAVAPAKAPFTIATERAERWLRERAGTLDRLPEVIAARYGKDRTFSVPILVTLAISGRFGAQLWREIPPLPFELAVLPRGLFGALRLPVVSYALPALIAIGHAIHHHAPSANPLARLVRKSTATRALATLERLQPPNGGFLEATPLTAFVTMSLAAAGQARSPVAQRATAFLAASVREDGSWPIDTNLSIWVTTLSIKALSHEPDILSPQEKCGLRKSLLAEQSAAIHPYTGAAAGAWAWTDLPGGVPDADDTAGALVALHRLGKTDTPTREAAEKGLEWLLGLQNRDGGIPTFCRGWGTLPFDRSTPEITAHTLRAIYAWREEASPFLARRLQSASARALRYLERQQRADGSFEPLWFGNEDTEDESNPVYGTAQVLSALNELGATEVPDVRAKAANYLISLQHKNGGWGGGKGAPETVEETALALEALSACAEAREALGKGTERLLELLHAGEHPCPAPIGLYFARLWYFERLYPLIFAVSALGRVKGALSRRPSAGGGDVSSPLPPASLIQTAL